MRSVEDRYARAREAKLEIVRSALEAHGCRPRGGLTLEARCPAHEDRRPSLGVSLGRKLVLMHCHAACDVRDIHAALGLSWDDVYYDAADGRWRDGQHRDGRPVTEADRRRMEFQRVIRLGAVSMARQERLAALPGGPSPDRGRLAVGFAEALEKDDQREHCDQVRARHAALACDREFVKAARATRPWQRSYEQSAVLALLRAEREA